MKRFSQYNICGYKKVRRAVLGSGGPRFCHDNCPAYTMRVKCPSCRKSRRWTPPDNNPTCCLKECTADNFCLQIEHLCESCEAEA
jgi:hypothetical protein